MDPGCPSNPAFPEYKLMSHNSGAAHITEAFRLAQTFHRSGQLAQAAPLYREILKTHPAHFDSLHMLALLEYQSGRGEESIRLLDRALAIRPDAVSAMANRGNVLVAMKRYEEALDSFDRALALRSNDAELYRNRGVVLRELGRYEDALADYDRALALSPDNAEACNNRGNVLVSLSRPKDAIASFDRALALRPDLAQAHLGRGNALQKLGRYDEALTSYSRATEIRPDYAEAYSNRGNLLSELNRMEEALPSYDRALALRPDNAGGYYSRGNVLRELNRFEESLSDYERALTLRPGLIEAYAGRSILMVYLRRFKEAGEDIDRILALQPEYPEARYIDGICRLLRGDFEPGWHGYEWRRKIRQGEGMRAFTQAPWRGRDDLAGKAILLYAEQGHGDTIQFCRYAKHVADRGARVLLEVQPALKSLLARLAGPVQTLAAGEPLPSFDFHCPLMSLPLAFGTTLQTIPADVPYLAPSQAGVQAWQARLGRTNSLRVGLAWSGRSAHKNDYNRSIHLAALDPILSTGASFVSVQKEARAHDQDTLASNPQIRHFGDQLHDYDDTAALIDSLDLVITVDTSVAHLAGALGKPVWILLPYNPDWRWMLEREDSPWYPTARLFRQPQIGDWDSVIRRVAETLRKLL
jgi:tetratricopeptide (TPR) repeat protein